MQRTLACLLVAALLLAVPHAESSRIESSFGDIGGVVAQPAEFLAGLAFPRIELRPVAVGGVEIVDRHGELLYEFAGPTGGWHEPVPLDGISRHLVEATIATEDADFYSNPGVNFRGLGRAIFENLAFWNHGGFFQGSGGSSITQQVVKILRVAGEPGERSPWRKFQEIMAALGLAREHSKDAILEFYLNSMFYGSRAYGAEAAAQRYFGKPASDLTVGEASLLAGIPNAPAIFDPSHAFERARARQLQVLGLMVRHGFISSEEAEAAFEEPIELESARSPSMQASHFVLYVHGLLPQLIDDAALRAGVRVTTTLDLSLQRVAEEIIEGHLVSLEPRLGRLDGALVAMDPRSGEILAMVGGRSFDDPKSGQVNKALALNQPGSAIKPITYLAAFEKGWSPATMVVDQPITLSDGRSPYILQNFDGRYSGRVSVREALGNSLNPPAVQALQYAGLDYVHSLAGRMGISTLEEVGSYGPAFTLGGVDVTLLDLTLAYAVLANGGEQRGMPSVVTSAVVRRPRDPAPVLRVEDLTGRVLWQFTTTAERVASAPHTYLVTSILSDNSARTRTFGPSSLLNLPGRPAAVKTGLSDGPREAWTLGYTPQLVAGVWVGHDDNAPIPGASSVQVASPVWHRFMVHALAGEAAVAFEAPEGIVNGRVCQTTGLLADARCPRVATEVFAADQVPVAAAAPPRAAPSLRQDGAQPGISSPAQPAPQRGAKGADQAKGGSKGKGRR